MRAIWSALVVLVLLAPFGGVGITTTPIETEIVASPRSPVASIASIRLGGERPMLPAARVAIPERTAIRRDATTLLSPIVSVHRSTATGSRAPPV